MIIDYVNRDTAPSWRKKVNVLVRKYKEPLILLSIVLVASLAGSM